MTFTETLLASSSSSWIPTWFVKHNATTAGNINLSYVNGNQTLAVVTSVDFGFIAAGSETVQTAYLYTNLGAYPFFVQALSVGASQSNYMKWTGFHVLGHTDSIQFVSTAPNSYCTVCAMGFQVGIRTVIR